MAGRRYHTSLHAEMNALFKSIKVQDKRNRICKKIKYYRPATTIYIVRLMKGTPYNQGKKTAFGFGISKPCLHCQKSLREYNVTRVKYTDIINGIDVLCEMRLI